MLRSPFLSNSADSKALFRPSKRKWIHEAIIHRSSSELRVYLWACITNISRHSMHIYRRTILLSHCDLLSTLSSWSRVDWTPNILACTMLSVLGSHKHIFRQEDVITRKLHLVWTQKYMCTSFAWIDGPFSRDCGHFNFRIHLHVVYNTVH